MERLSWVGFDSGDNETNKRSEVAIDGGDKSTTVNQNNRKISIPGCGIERRIGLGLAGLGRVELGWIRFVAATKCRWAGTPVFWFWRSKYGQTP